MNFLSDSFVFTIQYYYKQSTFCELTNFSSFFQNENVYFEKIKEAKFCFCDLFASLRPGWSKQVGCYMNRFFSVLHDSIVQHFWLLPVFVTNVRFSPCDGKEPMCLNPLCFKIEFDVLLLRMVKIDNVQIT